MAKKDKKDKKVKKVKKAEKVKRVKKAKKVKVGKLDALKAELTAEAIQARYDEKQPKSRTFSVRCTEEDLMKWRAAAEQRELTLSALSTGLLDVYFDKLA